MLSVVGVSIGNVFTTGALSVLSPSLSLGAIVVTTAEGESSVITSFVGAVLSGIFSPTGFGTVTAPFWGYGIYINPKTMASTPIPAPMPTYFTEITTIRFII